MFYYKNNVFNTYTKCDTEIIKPEYEQISEVEYNNKTKKQRTIFRINQLKKLLADTDYQAIKYAEGMISENDYQPIKAQRQAWRDEINQLELSLT